MTDLRAGLIGLGMMGRNHARVLRSLSGVDFVGAADSFGDQYAALQNETLYPNLEALIEAGIDMCVVALPTEMHLEAGLMLAEAGVHALIEKPLALNRDECTQLVSAFEAKDLLACVGHIERFNPALQALRKRLDEGELGEVFQIATRRQGPFPHRIRDVGVVMDLATHDIDLTAWVAGSHYQMVSAQTANRSEIEHEDLVSVNGKLKDDTVVNHLVNWLSPTKERVTIVTGERGAFVADTLTADLTFFANGDVATEWDHIKTFRGVSEGDMTRFAIAKPEPLKTELEAFRDGILGERHDYVRAADGMASVSVAQACLESARTGKTITID